MFLSEKITKLFLCKRILQFWDHTIFFTQTARKNCWESERKDNFLWKKQLERSCAHIKVLSKTLLKCFWSRIEKFVPTVRKSNITFWKKVATLFVCTRISRFCQNCRNHFCWNSDKKTQVPRKKMRNQKNKKVLFHFLKACLKH